MTEKNDPVVIEEELLGEENDFTEDELNDEDFNWKEKALELKGLNKRRLKKLSKIKESGVLDPKPEEPKPTSIESKVEPKKEDSNYAERFDNLTLQVAGITESEQIEQVKKSAKSLGVSIEEALQDKVVQSKLKEMQEEVKTKNAIPEVTGRSAGSPRNEVDYWIQKNELPTDNPKLRREVVLEKVKQSKSSTGLPLYRQ